MKTEAACAIFDSILEAEQGRDEKGRFAKGNKIASKKPDLTPRFSRVVRPGGSQAGRPDPGPRTPAQVRGREQQRIQSKVKTQQSRERKLKTGKTIRAEDSIDFRTAANKSNSARSITSVYAAIGANDARGGRRKANEPDHVHGRRFATVTTHPKHFEIRPSGGPSNYGFVVAKVRGAGWLVVEKPGQGLILVPRLARDSGRKRRGKRGGRRARERDIARSGGPD